MLHNSRSAEVVMENEIPPVTSMPAMRTEYRFAL